MKGFLFLRCVDFKYYHPETGDPDPRPCPRSSKVCWFIHPNEPEWDEIGGGGGNLSSPPGRYGRGGRGGSSSRRGREASRSRSRGRSRSMSKGRGERGRSRSRSRSNGRYVSPSRRRPRPSPPPRRPLSERIQRSPSPPSRSTSRRPRSYSHNRRPQGRRPRTPTPISSSRGHTPPKLKALDRSPRTVKVEPPLDIVPRVSSNPVNPALGNTSAVDNQPPVPPRVSADRNQHQGSSSDLSLREHVSATVDSTSPQPTSPQADPLSPIFAPETPVIPGLSTSVQLTRPQITAMSALQKSLELVIKDQAINPSMQPSTTPLPVNSSTPHPATTPEGGKTEIWTTRVKCVELITFVKGSRVLLTPPLTNFCIGYGLT